MENLSLFTTNIGTYKFLLLPGHLPSIQSCGCFLFLMGGHLLTSCMALQTFRSILIKVCTRQLAFRRCPPLIFKKISSWSHLLKKFITHILVYKKIMVLLWSSFCKNILICWFTNWRTNQLIRRRGYFLHRKSENSSLFLLHLLPSLFYSLPRLWSCSIAL